MCLPPFLFALPAIEGGRIIVTEIGSLIEEVAEGSTLPRRQEMPLPVWGETLNLSEEED